jgi:hypothetical protein
MSQGASIDSMSELVNGLKPFQIQMEAILNQTAESDGLRLSDRFDLPVLNSAWLLGPWWRRETNEPTEPELLLPEKVT